MRANIGSWLPPLLIRASEAAPGGCEEPWDMHGMWQENVRRSLRFLERCTRDVAHCTMHYRRTGCSWRSAKANGLDSSAVSNSGMPRRRAPQPSGTSPLEKSSCGMSRQAAAFLILSLAAYVGYRYWSGYPGLIPNQRAVRHIDRMARRRGISHEAAYRRWANRRLNWSRYRYLVRRA